MTNAARLTLLLPAFVLLGCPSSVTGIDSATDTAAASTGTVATTGPRPTTTTATTTGSGSGSLSSSGVTGSSSSGTSPPECTDARQCDNGDICDGVEGCEDGLCVPGAALECEDDGVDCTINECDPKLGCTYTPSNARCGCEETCDPELGCGDYCVPAECTGMQYACGNCIDDDLDCMVDSADPDCFGPCDNNEEGFNGKIPGQQEQSTCLQMDCYFDFNSGAGNDECHWSHSCDPLEPSGCTYDPEHNSPGTPNSCEELFDAQQQECLDYCLPIVPNGCDCFGCCEVRIAEGSEETATVYLGTQNADGDGTCELGVIDDPELCNPCTQVEGCLNPCGDCELCLGDVVIPKDCDEQECPDDAQACGLAGQEPCPQFFSCITGCCLPNPG